MNNSISRRTFLYTASVGATALGASPLRAEGTANRPNIVMIVGDDQGWTDFGFMGHKLIRTPRLDRLAAESAVFPFGYTPCSLCRASLATLLTGLYPHQHRICCNDPPAGVDRTAMHPFMRSAPAVPRLLGRAGYRSLQTGKFWEGHFANAGFTHGQTTNQDRHIARKAPQIGRQTMQPIYDFIDESGTTPFFVWYAPMMPHLPHTPPERILKHYRSGRDLNLARYYAMCEWFDETCGQLLDFLDRRKLADRTLVTFCIDNSWIQPTVPEKTEGPFGGPRGKLSPYDGGIRTPILVRWPGHTRAGRFHDLVSTIDLAPTLLTACGVPVPKPMHGLDLLPAASRQARLKRNAVFGEIYTHNCHKLGHPELDVTHRWVREGEWKLIVPADGKNVELFNLAQDPAEKSNLAAMEAARVRRLRAVLASWVSSR